MVHSFHLSGKVVPLGWKDKNVLCSEKNKGCLVENVRYIWKNLPRLYLNIYRKYSAEGVICSDFICTLAMSDEALSAFICNTKLFVLEVRI